MSTPNEPTTATSVTLTSTGAPAAPEAPATPPETPPATPPAAPESVKRSLEDSLAALDDDTKAFVLAEVSKARNEARTQRQKAKDADPAKVRADLMAEIAKAMGGGDEPVDPAKLAEQLTASQAAAQQSALELAVYRASAGVADPGALLDSRSFLAKLADVDPTDAAAVAAAVSEAVAVNPAFGLAPGKRTPAPNPALGSSASGAPDLEAQIKAAEKAGDIRTVIALQNQKLLTAPRQ